MTNFLKNWVTCIKLIQIFNENQRLFREQHRLCEKIMEYNDKLVKKHTSNSLLMRQIRLREQIEETRGYNEGQIAVLHNFKNIGIRKNLQVLY